MRTRHFATALEAVAALRAEGFAVYGMETSSRSHVRARGTAKRRGREPKRQ